MAEETANPEHPGVTSTKAAKEIVDQTSYSDIIRGPQFDSDLDPNVHGIEVLTDGNVQILTEQGNNRTIPFVTGRIYPIKVQEIVSNNTALSRDDILVYIS